MTPEEELEETVFDFLCRVEDMKGKLPRDLEECVSGVCWGLRGTIGEELKRHGVPLRHTAGRKKT